MRSTDTWQLRTQSASANAVRFEDLRRSYRAHLGRDRAKLVTLSAQLAHAEQDATRVYDELRQLARRMAGAAAIFEEMRIGTAAISLEQAATAATRSRADNSDAATWTALESLVDLLKMSRS
jgi:HPt (histidine-containing phosphotransfer) domain-containing protein